MKAMESALSKGRARAENDSGIKFLGTEEKKVGGVYYNYELKTMPGSQYGDYRLYGNLETYVENGKEIPIIVFRAGRMTH